MLTYIISSYFQKFHCKKNNHCQESVSTSLHSEAQHSNSYWPPSRWPSPSIPIIMLLLPLFCGWLTTPAICRMCSLNWRGPLSLRETWHSLWNVTRPKKNKSKIGPCSRTHKRCPHATAWPDFRMMVSHDPFFSWEQHRSGVGIMTEMAAWSLVCYARQIFDLAGRLCFPRKKLCDGRTEKCQSQTDRPHCAKEETRSRTKSYYPWIGIFQCQFMFGT